MPEPDRLRSKMWRSRAPRPMPKEGDRAESGGPAWTEKSSRQLSNRSRRFQPR
jgi:hypothetical protein